MSIFESVKTVEDIYRNVLNFPQELPDIKEVLKGNPIYFLYIEHQGQYYFAFSKFCSQKGMNLNTYRTKVFNSTQGTPAQKTISKILGPWKPFNKVSPNIQEIFKKWIIGKIKIKNLTKLKFLEVTLPQNEQLLDIIPLILQKNDKSNNLRRTISKFTFEKILSRKQEVGNTGEQIAYQYEKKRIGKQGKIEKIYLNNVGAGYDLYSIDTKGNERFIEVKTTLSKTNRFYISENEWITLKTKGDKGFIYFVCITDMTQSQAEVHEIQNPVAYLENNGTIEELKTYKVTL